MGLIIENNVVIKYEKEVDVTEVVIPDGVTGIAGHAFYCHDELTSVHIPEGVTSIGSYAFSWCENLESIKIPNSVMSIDYGVFSDCKNLKIVNIPASVVAIKESAFGYCRNLKEVHISDLSAWCRIVFSDYSSNPLRNNAALFINGESIEKGLIIPEDVKEIRNYVFAGCENLTSINIHPSIFKIGKDAFAFCDNLKEVHIPEGVTSIGSDAFYSCKNLKIVNIPASVVAIKESAFGYCRNLKEVHISDLSAWCRIVFSDYSSNPLSNNAALFINNKSENDLTIPNDVNHILPFAFYGAANISKLTISNSISSIGEYAFKYCQNLSSIVIPDSTKIIGRSAFQDCEKLENVKLGEGLEEIDIYAFSGCKKLKIQIPKSVRKIYPESFEYISEIAVQDGSLPNWKEITVFGKYSNIPFYLLDVIINGSNGEFALIKSDIDSGETFAAKETVARSIRSVDGYFDFETYDAAFEAVKKVPSKAIIASYRYLYPYKLSKENNVKFEKWLKKQAEKVGRFWIGKENSEIITALFEKGIFDDKIAAKLIAYAKEKDLSEIVKVLTESSSLSGNATQIEINSLKFKNWIKNYTDSRRPKAAGKNSYVIEDGVLIEYKGGKKIAIVPDGVKKIGEKAFYENKKVKEIIIPESITEIGKQAFSHCGSLETIIIPDSVKTVESNYGFTHNIFNDCPKLKILVLPSIFADLIAEDIEYAFSMSSRYYYECTLELLVIPKAIYSNFDSYYKDATVACKKASALGFMLAKELYANNIDYDQYRKYALTQRKKLLPAIYDLDLVEALEFYDSEKKITAKTIDEYTEELPKSAVKCIRYLENWKLKNSGTVEESNKKQAKEGEGILELIEENSLKEVDKKFSNLYGMKVKDLPAVNGRDGNIASPYLLAALLYKEVPNVSYYSWMDIGWEDQDYKKIKKNVLNTSAISTNLLNVFDSTSLQNAFLKIAESVVEYTKKTKKHEMLRAVSLFATEDTMKKVLELGDQMKISKDYLYQYWCFNSSKAAILHADKKKYLGMYAKLRLCEEDEFREKFLSECGLDEDGSIVLDLGDRTVKATLQNNYTFVLTDKEGKELKSFPRTSADEAKFNIAKAKYKEIKLTVNSIFKNLKKRRMEDYLTGKAISGENWANNYMNEPIHKLFASTLVWVQNKKTFTILGNAFIDADGNPFTLDKKSKIKIAHVMEMDKSEISKWRSFFLDNRVSQPFEQIWELPIDFNSVEEDRYEGIVLNQKILMGKSAHGIEYHKPTDWYDDPELTFMNDSLVMPELGDTEKEDHIAFGKLKVAKQDRIANHVIYLLDKWTVFGRIAKDDISVMPFMDKYNLPQIKEFIDIASKNKAKNLSAALLEYKNSRFPEFDAFEDFTLEL